MSGNTSSVRCSTTPGTSTVPTVWPVDLLQTACKATPDSANGDEAELRRWWLIYTQPRQEKMLARNLFAKRLPFYLPLIERRSLSRGRPRSALVPLFSGYLFFFGTDDELAMADATQRVCTAQPVTDGERLRGELATVARLIATNAPLAHEARLRSGERVRVRSGPFAGMEGTVVRRQRQTRLLVAVTYLQQGVSIDFDDCSLEAI